MGFSPISFHLSTAGGLTTLILKFNLKMVFNMSAMKYIKNTFWLGCLVISACQSTSVEVPLSSLPSSNSLSSVAPSKLSNTPQTQSTLNPIFSSILPKLKAQTKLLILLPTYIPSDEPNPIYALIETVKPSEYQIMLAFTKDCTGGNACRLGGVSGEIVTPKISPITGNPVSLANGITGYFVNASCGANCSDATLTWEQNSGRYTIAIKAGSMTTLVKMANSALQQIK